jgi:hypothetical protein
MDQVTVRTPPRQSAKIGQAAAARALAAAIVPASSRATLVSRIGKIGRSDPGDEREIAAGWVDDAVMGASLDLTICKGRMATGVPFDFRIRIVGADAHRKSSASIPCLSGVDLHRPTQLATLGYRRRGPRTARKPDQRPMAMNGRYFGPGTSG